LKNYVHCLVCITRSPAVVEIADRIAYDALINDHLDNNTMFEAP